MVQDGLHNPDLDGVIAPPGCGVSKPCVLYMGRGVFRSGFWASLGARTDDVCFGHLGAVPGDLADGAVDAPLGCG